MSSSLSESGSTSATSGRARPRFYYGWINVILAGIAMTATLPGRTHGLGLIAQPLTLDPGLGVDEALFGKLNFWAIILGSAMCIPVGRMIDRFGTRPLLAGVSLALGLSVLGMSYASGVVALFVALVLIRGLGQGALSIVSMALIGKWFTRKLGHAMGVFTVLLAFGFIGSTVGVGEAVKAWGWRPAWAMLGWLLVAGLAPLGWLLARNSPESVGLPVDGQPPTTARAPLDLPLREALRAPAFWVFTVSMALFNLSWSAITLFNQSILDEHRLGGSFVKVMAVLVFSGLPTNLIAGWLSTRWPMGRLLAIGMGVMALSLACFPRVTTEPQAMAYSAGLGIAGGIVTVVFFAIYGHAFGRESLGAIQAVAQVVSVFASALGPVLLIELKGRYGSSDPLFLGVAVLAVIAAVPCWFVTLPKRTEADAQPVAARGG